jgi:hypothetical protein
MAELERFQNLAPISPSRGEIKKERKISPGATLTFVIARLDRAMTEFERFQDLAPISPLAGEMSRSDREGYFPHFPVA